MAFLSNPPTIPFDQLQWQETGEEEDPKSRLLAHIRIGDLDMHLEAWEVEWHVADDSYTIQCVKTASMRSDDFDQLCGMMDCSFRTTEIDGREYVLVAVPYGD